jgi:hypothetical protein
MFKISLSSKDRSIVHNFKDVKHILPELLRAKFAKKIQSLFRAKKQR